MDKVWTGKVSFHSLVSSVMIGCTVILLAARFAINQIVGVVIPASQNSAVELSLQLQTYKLLHTGKPKAAQTACLHICIFIISQLSYSGPLVGQPIGDAETNAYKQLLLPTNCQPL